MGAVLTQRIIKITFLATDILEPIFAFSVAVNVAGIVFTFNDEETFFGN